MKKTFGNLSNYFMSRADMKMIKGGEMSVEGDEGSTTCSTSCNNGRSDCVKSCHGCKCECEVSGGGSCS